MRSVEMIVFPAYAGMSPLPHEAPQRPHRFPRLRGDEPTYGERTAYEQMFSPPTRG